MAIPHNTAYIASKFALEGFSGSLRTEVRTDGVSVTVISPYWVVTEFHEHYIDRAGRPEEPDDRNIYTSSTMTADTCARIILEGARRRKREVVMRPGRLALMLKLLAPDLLGRLILRFLLGPVIRRA